MEDGLNGAADVEDGGDVVLADVLGEGFFVGEDEPLIGGRSDKVGGGKAFADPDGGGFRSGDFVDPVEGQGQSCLDGAVECFGLIDGGHQDAVEAHEEDDLGEGPGDADADEVVGEGVGVEVRESLADAGAEVVDLGEAGVVEGGDFEVGEGADVVVGDFPGDATDGFGEAAVGGGLALEDDVVGEDEVDGQAVDVRVALEGFFEGAGMEGGIVEGVRDGDGGEGGGGGEVDEGDAGDAVG